MDKRTKLSLNLNESNCDSSSEEDELIMESPIQAVRSSVKIKLYGHNYMVNEYSDFLL